MQSENQPAKTRQPFQSLHNKSLSCSEQQKNKIFFDLTNKENLNPSQKKNNSFEKENKQSEKPTHQRKNASMEWADNIPTLPLGRITLVSQPQGINELQNVKYTVEHMKGGERLSYVESYLMKKFKEVHEKLRQASSLYVGLEKQNKNLKQQNKKLLREGKISKTNSDWFEGYSKIKEKEVKHMIGDEYKFKSKVLRVYNWKELKIDDAVYAKIDKRNDH